MQYDCQIIVCSSIIWINLKLNVDNTVQISQKSSLSKKSAARYSRSLNCSCNACWSINRHMLYCCCQPPCSCRPNQKLLSLHYQTIPYTSYVETYLCIKISLQMDVSPLATEQTSFSFILRECVITTLNIMIQSVCFGRKHRMFCSLWNIIRFVRNRTLW